MSDVKTNKNLHVVIDADVWDALKPCTETLGNRRCVEGALRLVARIDALARQDGDDAVVSRVMADIALGNIDRALEAIRRCKDGM